MYFIYVIYSKEHDKFYHGMTADLTQRLKQHNLGKVRSTKAFKPWVIIYSEEFENMVLARERELFLKTSTGRRFLKSIKEAAKIKLSNS
jgi:putative endonuclease